jgi:hypothetical protein
LVKFDGRSVLNETVHAHVKAQSAIYVGSNPVGGTVCGPSFSGTIRYSMIRHITPASLWASLKPQLGAIPVIVAIMFVLSFLLVLQPSATRPHGVNWLDGSGGPWRRRERLP